MASTTPGRSRPAMPAPPRRAPSPFVRDWVTMSAPMIVLRLFLGVTFVYAGAQKLLDPNFLRAGSPDFIGTQLRGFAQGSPIAWLLDPMSHVAVLAGVGVALLEIGIGLGTLGGIAPRAAAAGGLLVSAALLLSATWHVHPYFLGSDSVYAVAWGAYLLGLRERTRRSAAPSARAARHAAPGTLDRRELLRGATLAGATLATGAAAKLLSGTDAAATLAATRSGSAGSLPASSRPSTGSARTGGDTASSGSSGATPGSPVSNAPRPVKGTPVVNLSKVQVGEAVAFQAPNGTPAALVRLSQNDVVAYSRVCTHAGCLVGYDPSQRILYCPCHGAEFDPAHHADVLGGPAPRPLEEIPVTVDPTTGEVVVPKQA
jgi:thiosulfate dehydrogenase (quinone) large subunit